MGGGALLFNPQDLFTITVSRRACTCQALYHWATLLLNPGISGFPQEGFYLGGSLRRNSCRVEEAAFLFCVLPLLTHFPQGVCWSEARWRPEGFTETCFGNTQGFEPRALALSYIPSLETECHQVDHARLKLVIPSQLPRVLGLLAIYHHAQQILNL